jgi:hypothetical protein
MFEGLLNQGCWVSFGYLSNMKTVYPCGVRVDARTVFQDEFCVISQVKYPHNTTLPLYLLFTPIAI